MTRKIDRILIPLLFFLLVSGLFELILPVNFTDPFNGPFWFLQAVFSAIIVYYLIHFLVEKTLIIHLIVLACSLLAYLFSYLNIKLDFDLDLVLMAVAFLHLGFVVKDYYKKLSKFNQFFCVSCSVVCMFLGWG